MGELFMRKDIAAAPVRPGLSLKQGRRRGAGSRVYVSLYCNRRLRKYPGVAPRPLQVIITESLPDFIHFQRIVERNIRGPSLIRIRYFDFYLRDIKAFMNVFFSQFHFFLLRKSSDHFSGFGL